MKRIPKAIVERIPLVRIIASQLHYRVSEMQFGGSPNYWEKRYSKGGNSGAGSQGELREFKARTLNKFIDKHHIETVIEFGCGDGRQLTLANYPKYIGFDVSETAVLLCQQLFKDDETKSFYTYDPLSFGGVRDQSHAELAISLDVIYHLVEDEIYSTYMMHLFGAAARYVVIYSTNVELRKSVAHIKHREFVTFVRKRLPQWRLINEVKNPFADEMFEDETLASDFYFFKNYHLNV